MASDRKDDMVTIGDGPHRARDLTSAHSLPHQRGGAHGLKT
jgi:hypothetical protein